MKADPNCILMVLAAGEASRMGQPKQLIPVFGLPLIDFQLPRWRKVFAGRPVIVTGAFDKQIRKMSRLDRVNWVHNPLWKSGMGSSIRRGMSFITTHEKDASAALIVLLDQLFVGPCHLLELIHAWNRSPEMLIASGFRQTAGPPVIFPRNFWGDLLKMNPGKGAGFMFRKYPDKLRVIENPHAAYDLDTPADRKDYLTRLVRPPSI